MNVKMWMAVVVGLAAGGVSLAEDPPMPEAAEAAAKPAPVVLFACVKVDDEDEMAPCAKPLVVAIADPCNPCLCRFVQICVPDTCCPPEIKCSKCGTKVTYDYGEYSVEIKSKTDYVEVEYDD
jgi:hypothetical protein